MFSDLGNNHVLKRAVSGVGRRQGDLARTAAPGDGGGRAGLEPVPELKEAVGCQGCRLGWVEV